MGLVAKPVYQQVPDSRPAPTSAPRLTEAALTAFGCDVSFISDDSTPAEELVARAVEQANSQDLKHLLWETFDRLRADYQVGSSIAHPAAVATRIGQAASAMGLELSPDQRRAIFCFFDDVNHVLFQHQTLSWLADANFKVHLYGTGWEYHPALARHARGSIRDDRMRGAIFSASKINLSAGAYGAVTPRLLEGVAQGAFFLIRFCAADVIEKFFPPLIDFCARERIASNEMLSERATPGIRSLLAFASRTLGVDVLADWPGFVTHLLSSRSDQRSRSAAVLWPDFYPSVCFSSRDELVNLVTKFLYDQPQRRRIADGMRRELTSPAQQRVSVQVSRSAIAPRLADDVAA